VGKKLLLFLCRSIGKGIRLIGLSTAVGNAQDVADWLGIGTAGMFNFRPSVRPVPLEVHIQVSQRALYSCQQQSNDFIA